MRLICGCPVAARAWAIPRWMECLAAQTRRPDALLFIFSGQWGDPTYQALIDEADRHEFPFHIVHEGEHWHPRHDDKRFETLARLRNLLLLKARGHGADLFLSLDSDIMLEDPETIAKLEGMVLAGGEHGCDIASCATFFHPAMSTPGLAFDFRFAWSYNAGFFTTHPGDPYSENYAWMSDHRPWRRPAPEGDGEGNRQILRVFELGLTIPIDIPMGVWLGNRRAMDCRYKHHSMGEDLGYAQDLERKGLRVLWNAGIRAKHVWSEDHMRQVPEADHVRRLG